MKIGYSYIPLRLMAALAAKQDLQIKSELEATFKLLPELRETYAQLAAYTESSGSAPGDWAANDEAARALRRRFLHVSFSSNSTGMSVRTIPKADGTYIPCRDIHHG